MQGRHLLRDHLPRRRRRQGDPGRLAPLRRDRAGAALRRAHLRGAQGDRRAAASTSGPTSPRPTRRRTATPSCGSSSSSTTKTSASGRCRRALRWPRRPSGCRRSSSSALVACPASGMPHLVSCCYDKVLHASEYAGFGFLLSRAALRRARAGGWRGHRRARSSASSDEFHQSFVAGPLGQRPRRHDRRPRRLDRSAPSPGVLVLRLQRADGTKSA